MAAALQLVVFTLDEQRYGLQLAAVERVVRMVEVTPLPQAPQIVLGVINAQGSIIPVVDVRKRLRLPAREPHPSDHLLIARTAKRGVALVVDAVSEVVTLSSQHMVSGETILAQLAYVTGVVKRPDGLILIHDFDRFLSLDEEQALHDAIGAMTP